jgi:hypothetical protein
MSRYTFAGGNPTSLVEYDGHMPAIDSGGGAGGGGDGANVFPLLCTDATPEYCHAPGENNMSPYDLGWQWLGREGAGIWRCKVRRSCVTSERVEYFGGGDSFTEGIRGSQHIDVARAVIAARLLADEGSGDFPLLYGDESISPDDRKELHWATLDSILTGGLTGMPLEQAFLGSYTLEWDVVGEHNGDVVVEFLLTNASTLNSVNPDPDKVNAERYGQNNPGNGEDAASGEWYTRQSVRWREVFPGGGAPAGPRQWRPLLLGSPRTPFSEPWYFAPRPSNLLKPIYAGISKVRGF